jgi:predicted CoA-binding protein
MTVDRFSNPDEHRIRELLVQARVLAVVGLSPKPERPSHWVSAAMQRFGYRIIPVHPAVETVLGERAYPDLYAVPERVDLVVVFLSPHRVGPVVDACIELGVPAVWLQDGVVNEAAAARARDAGLVTVMDRCVYRDYGRLIAGQGAGG